MGQIRVFIVSDSLTFSDGLKSLLAAEVKIIGQEVDTTPAIARIKALKPDVIIWANTGMQSDALKDEIRLREAVPLTRMVSLSLQNNVIVTRYLGKKTVRIAHDTSDIIEVVKRHLLPSLVNRKRPGLLHRLNREMS